jgi:hypothetical protein
LGKGESRRTQCFHVTNQELTRTTTKRGGKRRRTTNDEREPLKLRTDGVGDFVYDILYDTVVRFTKNLCWSLIQFVLPWSYLTHHAVPWYTSIIHQQLRIIPTSDNNDKGRMSALPVKFFVILTLPLCSHSFVPKKVALRHRQQTTSTRPNIALPRCSALTERQMQFWEDVEDGLAEIETYFQKQGQSLERIRKFVKR